MAKITEEHIEFFDAFKEPTKIYSECQKYRRLHCPAPFLRRSLTYVKIFERIINKPTKKRPKREKLTTSQMVDRLMEKKVKHYLNISIIDFSCKAINIECYALIEMFHFESNKKLGSVLLNIDPRKSPNVKKSPCMLRVPCELLQITSRDGEALDIKSCIIQFRIRLMKGDRPIGKIPPEMYHFNARLQLFNADEKELIANDPYEIECTNKYIMAATKQGIPWIHANNTEEVSLTSFSELPLLIVDFKWSSDIDFNKINRENSISEFKSKLRPRTKSIYCSQRKVSKNVEPYIIYRFIDNNYYKDTCYYLSYGCPCFKYAGTHKEEIRIHVLINRSASKQSQEEILFIPSKRGNERCRKWKPRRRQEFTKIITCYPKDIRSVVFDFLTIRRGGFFHSATGLPLFPKEISIDSDDDSELKWLREDTVRMIDDFRDLNSGEKAIMKLWNLHMLKYLHVKHASLLPIIFEFIETHGEYILANRLQRNCILHLVNLFDFELLPSSQFVAAIKILYNLADDKPDVKAKMFEYVEDDRRNYSTAKNNLLNGKKLESKETSKQKRSQSTSSKSRKKQSKAKRGSEKNGCKPKKLKVKTSKKPSSRKRRKDSISASQSRQVKQKSPEVTPSRKRKSTAAAPEMPAKVSSRMLRSNSIYGPRPGQIHEIEE